SGPLAPALTTPAGAGLPSAVTAATCAPAYGAPIASATAVDWAVAVTVAPNGVPTTAFPGPSSHRNARPLKASLTHSTSSPPWTRSWQPPTGGKLRLTRTPHHHSRALSSASGPQRVRR